MIKKDVGSKLKAGIFTYGIMFLTLFNALYWQHEPQILQQDVISFKYLLANILHGFSVTGPVLALLLIGYLIAHSKTIGPAQIWGWLFVGSWISLFVLYFLQATDPVWVGYFYNAIFPILRNAYPLISGVLLGTLTLKWTKKIFAATPYIYVAFFVGMIVFPTVFAQDIFSYNGGSSIVYAWVIFTLGADLPVSKLWTKTWGYLFGSTVLLVLFLGVMPLISEGSHGDLSTAARFTNSASLFPVLFSLCLMSFIVKMTAWKKQYTYIFNLIGALLLATNGALIELTNELNTKATLGLRYLQLLEAVLLPLAIALVVWLYRKTRWSKTLANCDIRSSAWTLDNLDQNIKASGFELKMKIVQHKYQLLVAGTMLVWAYLSFVVTNVNGHVADSMTGDIAFNAWTFSILQRPQMIVFTALLFICLHLFLRGLTNNFWLSFLSSNYLIIIWLIATRLKIDSRREPILPAEAGMVRAYGDLLHMVPTGYLWLGGSLLLCLILGSIWLTKKQKISKLPLKRRVKWILIPLIVIFSSCYWNHEGFILKKAMRNIGNDPLFHHQLYAAQLNGPTIQFLNNIDIVVMERPKDYSKAKIQEIVAKYSAKAKDINAKRTSTLSEQTVIFNLSESFSDPSHVAGTKLKNDPIPNVHQLMSQNVGGYMLSSSYGGGTANMEYMTLTGFPMANFAPTISTPYAQVVASRPYTPSIVDYFPNAVAIHPYVGNFYSRPVVYDKFGFDDFIYLGSKTGIKYQENVGKNPYLSDKTAYLNALEAIKNNKDLGQFINLVTIQNHTPYGDDYYDGMNEYEATEAVDIDNTRNAINSFAKGIHYTDEYVAEFIEQIDQIQKPITLVFYGDHLPGIYANEMDKDGLNLHETDYFVYSNKYAQQNGAKNSLNKSKIISPNDFPAMVAEKVNAKISPYYALLTAVYQQIPAIYMGNNPSSEKRRVVDYVTENEQILTEKQLSAEQKEILEDLRLIQYDITAGENYVKETKFMQLP